MRHGFLLIDKSVGPTSHDIVAIIRKQLGERSIGHLGTLDPDASGLLVLAVGKKALKVIELFNNLSKEYHASVRFGAVSTTYDAAGIIEEQSPLPGRTPPDLSTLRRIIDERFIGRISQTPPAYAAVHINGVRAYDLARRGKMVAMQARTVEIDTCDVLAYEYPNLSIAVTCGSGTYIRSLAHDLGQVLRCGGYLTALRRTKVGEWDIEDAVTAQAVAWTDVRPLKDILANHPRVDLSDEEYSEICFGRIIEKSAKGETIAWHKGLPVAILQPMEKEGKIVLRPRKVF